MSYQYLVGAEIDYKDDLEGAQFVIKVQTHNRLVAAVLRSRYKQVPWCLNKKDAAASFYWCFQI